MNRLRLATSCSTPALRRAASSPAVWTPNQIVPSSKPKIYCHAPAVSQIESVYRKPGLTAPAREFSGTCFTGHSWFNHYHPSPYGGLNLTIEVAWKTLSFRPIFLWVRVGMLTKERALCVLLGPSPSIVAVRWGWRPRPWQRVRGPSLPPLGLVVVCLRTTCGHGMHRRKRRTFRRCRRTALYVGCMR